MKRKRKTNFKAKFKKAAKKCSKQKNMKYQTCMKKALKK